MKIAIVGYAGTNVHAPWDDDTWEVWGLNGAHLIEPFIQRDERGLISLRANRWFQIHPPNCTDKYERNWLEVLDEVGMRGQTMLTYVRAEDIPEWVRRYPNAERSLAPYPADALALAREYGWVTNTFCLEVALALSLGATDIGLYGVECGGYGRELAVEGRGLAYWIGIAMARGVTLHFPPISTMMPYEPVYGFDYWDEAKLAADLTSMLLPIREETNTVNLDTPDAVQAAKERACSSSSPTSTGSSTPSV